MVPRNSTPFWAFLFLLVLGHFLLRVGLGLSAYLPDLLMVAVLLGARRMRAPVAALFGLVLGLLEDALALSAFGARAAATAGVAFFGARSRDIFEGDSVIFLAVYLFVGKWAREATVYALDVRAGRGDAVMVLFVDGALAALYTAVAGTLAFLLYRAVTGER
jgi:rod shape-determining protein MreD